MKKPVVQNEKRQRVDNQTIWTQKLMLSKKLCILKGHPYNWEVIGELEDLQAATLDDDKRLL